MALYVVASAKGSPGVSVTTMALAAVWPTAPIVADLDPIGGDFGWRYRQPDGEPLSTQVGLISLGASARRSAETDLGPHLQQMAGGLSVLAGAPAPRQVQGLGTAWQNVAQVLASQDADVLADCGRLAPGTPLMPVLAAASRVLLLSRSNTEDIAHLRERVRDLADGLPHHPLVEDTETQPETATRLVVALVTRDAREVTEVQRLLDSARLPARVLGIISHAPKDADRLRRGIPFRGSRSWLLRSARGISHDLPAPTATLEQTAGGA